MITFDDAIDFYLDYCEVNGVTPASATSKSSADCRGAWMLRDADGNDIARVFPSAKVITADVDKQLRETLQRCLSAVELVEDSGDIGIIAAQLRAIAPDLDEFKAGLDGDWTNTDLESAVRCQPAGAS